MRVKLMVVASLALSLAGLPDLADAIEHDGVSAMAFAEDGNILVTAGGGRRVIVWDLVTGHARENFSVEMASEGVIWLSPNGEAYAWRDFLDDRMYVRNWKQNVERSWPSWDQKAPFDQPEIVPIFSANGRYLAVQVSKRFSGDYYRHDVHLYDAVSGDSSMISSPFLGQREIGFSSHGKPYRVQGGKPRYRLMGVTDQGELVLSDSGKVIVRDMAGTSESALGSIPPGALNPFVFYRTSYTKDFGLAVTRSGDQAVLWSIPDDRVVRDLGNASALGMLGIDPTGTFVAFHDPAAGRVVHLIETATGRDTAVEVLMNVGRPIFSSDGRFVAFAMPGGAITVLESATGLDAMRTRAERLTRQAESLGVTTRYGLHPGKIGQRLVPRIENTLYKTEVLFRLGDQEAVRVTGDTYSSGGGPEDVQGFHAVFGVSNQSGRNYLVDILIEATVSHSQWQKYEAFLTGRQSRQLQTSQSRLQASKRFLLKAGEQIKDQIAVGESEPADFSIFVSRLEEVDDSWISSLERALRAPLGSEEQARGLLPLLRELTADPRARGWRETLAARSKTAEDLVAAAELQRARDLFTVSTTVRPDYDPDFLNDVVVSVQSRAKGKHLVTVRCPGGREERLPVDAGSTAELTVKVQNLPKESLEASILKVEPMDRGAPE